MLHNPSLSRIISEIQEFQALLQKEEGRERGRVRIRTKERCPKCGKKFVTIENLGIFCPRCKTAPRRFYVYLSWKGRKIKIYSFRDGQPLSSWELAKRACEVIQHEIESGEFDPSKWVKSDVKKFFFSRLTEEYLHERKKVLSPAGFRAKRTWFRQYILPFFASKDVRDLRAYDLNAFLNHLLEKEGEKKKKLSLSTVKKIFVELKAFLNWCLRQELIERLPAFPDIKVSEPVIKFISPEQQAKILEALPQEHRPIVAFLFATGCRVGEARALQWDCIFIEEGFLVIRRTFSDSIIKEIPKEGRQKVIPLVGGIKEIIEEQARDKKSFFVFPYKDSRRKERWIPYPQKTLNRIFQEACRKAGIEGVTLYQAARHSFAVSRLAEGFSYEEIGAALGHSSPQTTRRYARLRAEQVKSIFEGAKVIPFWKQKDES